MFLIWICKVVFMVEIILNVTMLMPGRGVRDFFERHRIIAGIVAIISIIGFFAFVASL